MTRRILLVRHPPVAPEYAGVCYGFSDVPLGADGTEQAAALARTIAAEPVTHLYHSGLARCAAVVDRVSALTGVPAIVDARLRERCFGSWELRTWDDIYADTGDAMMGMIRFPGEWCPPGGETTFELRDRVVAWYRDLPGGEVIVVVTHGGPIAALRGALTGTPVGDWPGLIPAPGTITGIMPVRGWSR